MSTIAVIGAGSWGSALAQRLACNGHIVNIWGNEPEVLAEIKSASKNSKYLPDIALSTHIQAVTSLQQAISQSDAVLCVVPSHVFTQVCQEIAAIQPDLKDFAFATKGIEPKHCHLLTQVVADIWGEACAPVVLSGPTFAKEIASGNQAAMVAASTDRSAAVRWQQRLRSSTFTIELSDDVIGVQIGGAAKNVVAMAIGMIDGLGWGANARCALITASLQQMANLTEQLGGKSSTMLGLAGCGDLILTATDNQSRNRRFGLAIGQGESIEQAQKNIGQVVEGVHTIKQLKQLLATHQLQMPVCDVMEQVIYHDLAPIQAAKLLFS